MKPTAITTHCLAAALTIPCALLGCIAPASLPGDDPALAESSVCAGSGCNDPDDLAPGNRPILTANNNVHMLRGYHELLDTANQTCVEEGAAPGKPFEVGAVSGDTVLTYVTNQHEMARTLGVNLGVSAKYLAWSTPPWTLDVVSSVKEDARSVNLLFSIVREYSVVNRQDVTLTSSAYDVLKSDARAFVNRCGTGWVQEERYRAAVYAVITVTASTAASATDIKASLGINGKAGPVSIDATGSLSFHKALSDSEAQVSVKVWSAGWTGGDSSSAAIRDKMNSFLLATANENEFKDLLSALGDTTGALQKSIDADRANDAKDYVSNNNRSATLHSVVLGRYSALAPEQKAPAAIAEGLVRVKRFSRDMGELLALMDAACEGEIEPFADALEAGQGGGFQVASPGKPRSTVWELKPLADASRASLCGTGLARQPVALRAQDCWLAASDDLFTPACEDALKTQAWQDGARAFVQYAKERRVVPMAFATVEDGALKASNADARCHSIQRGGEVYRLPTFEELRFLAPVVAEGRNFPQSERPNRIWYTSGKPCEKGSAAFENSPAHPESFWCMINGWFSSWKLATVCVPTSGPVIPVRSDTEQLEARLLHADSSMVPQSAGSQGASTQEAWWDAIWGLAFDGDRDDGWQESDEWAGMSGAWGSWSEESRVPDDGSQ
ncbi:MAG: hypothetical protein HY898_19025 [Deltaproteobacteria bacterium]|nr:hypothetical protein [Deltaproteobacteria bacterium]